MNPFGWLFLAGAGVLVWMWRNERAAEATPAPTVVRKRRASRRRTIEKVAAAVAPEPAAPTPPKRKPGRPRKAKSEAAPDKVETKSEGTSEAVN